MGNTLMGTQLSYANQFPVAHSRVHILVPVTYVHPVLGNAQAIQNCNMNFALDLLETCDTHKYLQNFPTRHRIPLAH